MKKEDILKALRADPLYQSALKVAKTDEERKQVIAITEGFVSNFAGALGPLIERAEKDPAFLAQLQRSLASGEDVVSEGEPVASGSQG